jgi:hypothetical protein
MISSFPARRKAAAAAAVCAACFFLFSSDAGAAVVSKSSSGFTVEQEVELPLPPEIAYDAMTGDISGWWDHSFSDSPAELYIEAKPGGGFYEIFDETGDGVLHAAVTFARRGKLLRFHGPLGLAGSAIDMVTTWEYRPQGTGCVVKLTADAAGHVKEGWAEAVDATWRHFLVERLVPYVESGDYRSKLDEEDGADSE